MANNLRTLRLANSWTAEEAAAAMSMSTGGYIKLERGERGLTEATIRKAARAFKVSGEAVFAAEPTIISKEPRAFWEEPEGALSSENINDRDLMPIYATLPPVGQNQNFFTISKKGIINKIRRLSIMENIFNAYGFMISGMEMYPRYRLGDYAIVNPWRQPDVGKDAIFFYRDTTVHGDGIAILRTVEAIKHNLWVVRRLDEGKVEEIVHRDWPRAHRVVGILDAM